MQTSLNIDNANCPFCVSSTRAALLANPLVHDVTANLNAGCWQINHDLPDASAVLQVMQNSLHGWVVADNGEAEMVPIHMGPNDSCPLHGTRDISG